MTTTPDETSEFEFAGGSVTLALTPADDAMLNLAIKHRGEVLDSGVYPRDVFSRRTPKGQFLNSAEDALEDRDGVDATATRAELKQWLADMNEIKSEEKREHVLSDTVNAIIDGTQYPVEVYDGEPTVWKVTLEFEGRVRDLEFTASELISSGSEALEQKIANQFFEVVDIAGEDWEEIRDRWQEHKRIAHIAEETTADAIADRVLSKIRERAIAIADREKFGNDHANVWFDEGNSAAAEAAAPEADIVWVQDELLVSQIERVGKAIDYKGQLIKDLIEDGALYGSGVRRRWGDGHRVKVYPFDPESLGIDADDAGAADDPAHSEVDA